MYPYADTTAQACRDSPGRKPSDPSFNASSCQAFRHQTSIAALEFPVVSNWCHRLSNRIPLMHSSSLAHSRWNPSRTVYWRCEEAKAWHWFGTHFGRLSPHSFACCWTDRQLGATSSVCYGTCTCSQASWRSWGRPMNTSGRIRRV